MELIYNTDRWQSWSIAPDLKSGGAEKFPWVRILPYPPV